MDIENLYQRGLSLDKLRTFLAVVRAGTVTAAAGGEGSRRSLMSRQIGEFEKTLGFELFQRKGKTLVLTEAGREIALLTATYFNELGAFVERATTGESNLRLGAGASILEAVVLPRIREIRQRIPGFRFEFVTANTSGILRMLRGGEIDLGIVRSGDHGSNLVATPCGCVDFVLAGRLDFDSNLSEWGMGKFLQRVPLAMIAGEGEFVTGFQKLCESLEVRPQITIRTESFGQVKQLLLAGHPGGILPRQLAADFPPSLFSVIDSDVLKPLSRELVVVTDARVAQLKDRLHRCAGLLAEILLV